MQPIQLWLVVGETRRVVNTWDVTGSKTPPEGKFNVGDPLARRTLADEITYAVEDIEAGKHLEKDSTEL